MTQDNLTQKTNCNCNNNCDVPKNKNTSIKKKGLFGIITAMAICCVAPLGIGLFAGGAAALPLAIWFNNSAIYIGLACLVGVALWFYWKSKPNQIKS